jgi:hypothetical protein
MKCSYCNSEEHNILSCEIDNDKYLCIIGGSELPDFKSMSKKVLKKVSVLMSLNTSGMSKDAMVQNCINTWNNIDNQVRGGAPISESIMEEENDESQDESQDESDRIYTSDIVIHDDNIGTNSMYMYDLFESICAELDKMNHIEKNNITNIGIAAIIWCPIAYFVYRALYL